MKPIKRAISQVGTNALLALIPKHGKRAVFLSTLFMEVAKLSPEHRDLLRELNDKYDLVDEPYFLKVPFSLHDVLWEEHRGLFEGCRVDPSEEELTQVCKRVLDELPGWSNYGSYQDVLGETKDVVRRALRQRHAA